MDFSKLNFKTSSILKTAGIGIVAIIFLIFAANLLSTSFESLLGTGGVRLGGMSGGSTSVAYDAVAPMPQQYAKGEGYAGEADLSIRNIVSRPPMMPESPSGNEAEKFEVTDYQATVETRSLSETCAKLITLKAKDYVIFENANESERTCYYRFKVERAHVPEVLNVIKALDPKDLIENTQTIKKTLDDYTSEVEILEKKKQSIESTLESAIKAYDEITALATKAQDAASLAKIIDSKIQIIERLTQERINVGEQLDRLQRSKADQLDRVDYTYFSVNVYENKYLDGENLKDSWKAALKGFVQDMNKIAQDITINLIVLAFFVLQCLVYFFILLFIVKYAWKFAVRIWKK